MSERYPFELIVGKGSWKQTVRGTEAIPVRREVSLADFSSKWSDLGGVDESRVRSLSSGIEALFEEVGRCKIHLPNRSAVRDYLRRFGAMMERLPRILAELLEYKNDSVISLEVYRDPEITSEQLTFFIRQFEYSCDILNRIDRTRESLANDLYVSGSEICITTDFQLPKKK